jgi:siroheme synthase-like protein
MTQRVARPLAPGSVASASYPVVLHLDGRDCLVVGGGAVAAQKADGLTRSGALVTIVAELPGPDVEAMAEAGAVRLERRRYLPGDAATYWLVITTSDDAAENQLVHDDAVAARVWVNSADDPDRCAFTLPAIHRQGPVTVTASTGGASPALAVWLRDQIADAVGPEFATLAEQLAQRRAELRLTGGGAGGVTADGSGGDGGGRELSDGSAGAPSEGSDWRSLIEDGLRQLRQLDASLP